MHKYGEWKPHLFRFLEVFKFKSLWCHCSSSNRHLTLQIPPVNGRNRGFVENINTLHRNPSLWNDRHERSFQNLRHLVSQSMACLHRYVSPDSLASVAMKDHASLNLCREFVNRESKLNRPWKLKNQQSRFKRHPSCINPYNEAQNFHYSVLK